MLLGKIIKTNCKSLYDKLLLLMYNIKWETNGYVNNVSS